MNAEPHAHDRDEHPGCAFIDGEYTTLDAARIPIVDWGFLRGDCVYDAVPFSNGRLFRLRDHIERFWQSMDKWRLRCPYDQDFVHDVCHQLLRRSGLRDGLLLVTTTRGMPPSMTIRNPALFQNRFYAFASELAGLAPREQIRAGLRVIVSSIPRIPSQSIDATAKNFQWGDLTRARLQAHDAGADNALLLDYDGNLTEGPGFNVFVVNDAVVVTPSNDCLLGITRRTALEIAADLGYGTREGLFPGTILETAQEVFLATSAGGICPVIEIDGRPVGTGAVGPVTQRIYDEYWRRRNAPEWSEQVDYD